MTSGGEPSPKHGAQTLGSPRIRVRKGIRGALSLELRHHLPFTASAVVMTMGLVALLVTLGVDFVGRMAFPAAHFVHLFLSAVASTAVSWRQRPRIVLALAVGTGSAVSFCTVSDILLPFAGGYVAGFAPTFEVELLEAPVAVVGVALVGAAFGFVHLRHLSVYSHSLHVVASTYASLGYLLTHVSGAWFGWGAAPAVMVILFIAVFVPCCLSDIIMPVACTHCDFRETDRAHRH